MTGLDELPLHRAQVSVFWGFLGFYFVLRLNLILYFQPRLGPEALITFLLGLPRSGITSGGNHTQLPSHDRQCVQ